MQLRRRPEASRAPPAGPRKFPTDPRHARREPVTSLKTRGDPVDLWESGSGSALRLVAHACTSRAPHAWTEVQRGEFAVLSRSSAAAAASVAGDVYAENAGSASSKLPGSASPAPASSPVDRSAGPRAKPARAESSRGRTGGEGEARTCPVGRTSALTDQALLEGLRGGSEAHFAELYHRYFQRIYNFVFARVRNHVDCEEIVQETFIAVFRSFENYRGQSSLLSWIYGIAKNTTNNALRRARTQNERIDLVEEDDLLPIAALGSHSPDDFLDLHRFGDQLSERLEQVADWQAEIFAMRHFENLSIPEISKRTRRSSDAVRSSLYRVKRIFFETALPGGSHATASAGDRA